MKSDDPQTCLTRAQTAFEAGVSAYHRGALDEAVNDWQQALHEYQSLIDQGNEQLRANAATTLVNMGAALAGAGRLDDALGRFESALGQYQSLIEQGHEQLRADAAKTLVNIGASLADAGRLDDALGRYESALGQYQSLIEQGHEQLRADAAHTLMNMGNALAGAGRLDDALERYETALGQYQSLIEQGHEQLRADAATTLMNMGAALSDAGRLDDALGRYESALGQYQSLIDQGHEQLRANAATTLMNMGTALAGAGRLDDALGRYESALGQYQSLIEQGHEQLRADAAKTLVNIGASLADAGRLDDALGRYESALGQYQSLIGQGHEQLRANAANTLVNMGAALVRAGRLDDALGRFENALGQYQSLIGQGHEQLRANAAKTLANMGVALADAGRLDDALERYETALGQYQSLIEQGHEQLRADAATTLMNMGAALARAGRLDDALGRYESALGQYQSLIKQGHERLRADAATTLMNMGAALARAGRLNDALGRYESALGQYQSLIEQGHEQLRANAAYTLMNMGAALSDAGRLDDALGRYENALGVYQALAMAGQWQHTERLLVAAHIQTSLGWMRLAANAEAEGSMRDAKQWLSDLNEQTARLRRLAELEQAHGVEGDAQRLAMLRRGERTLRGWASQRPQWLDGAAPVDAAAMAFCAVWLDRMHDFLVDGSPAYVLNRFDADVAPILRQVLGWLMAHGRAEQVTLWHLRTQGLRAQRQSLLQARGDDPDLAELVRLTARLDELANRIAGTHLARGALPGLDGGENDGWVGSSSRVLMSTDTEGQAARIKSDMLAYERIKRLELEPLKRRLEKEGKLPQTPRLGLAALRERLTALATQGRRAVLLLLLPGDAAGADRTASISAVCVYADPGHDRLMHLPVSADLGTGLQEAWDSLLRDARLRANARGGWRGAVVTPLTDDNAGGSAGEFDMVNASAEPITPHVDLLTDDQHHEKLHRVCLGAAQTLRPWLAEFQRQGLDEVHVVPAGDWHLVPWAAELDQRLPGLTVRQFPTAVGWWRANEAAARGTDEPAEAWAALADAAEGRGRYELLWVGAELAGLQRLWDPAPIGETDRFHRLPPAQPQWPGEQAGATSAEVQGLVCLGHGDAPDDNLALAGLWLPARERGGAGASPWFMAGQLHQVRHARQLVMSCCVLGRIGDAKGEPLGMTALAFAFRTKMAVGAMLPIPDLEGALFSLAVHHAWSSAERPGNADAVKVFHETRRQVMAGRWPQGFGDWLVNEWWPVLRELTEEQDPAAPLRMQWLYGGKEEPEELIGQWAQAPSEQVKTVAAVSSCLG